MRATSHSTALAKGRGTKKLNGKDAEAYDNEILDELANVVGVVSAKTKLGGYVESRPD